MLESGGVNSAGPGDRVRIPEAEALDLAFDAFPVPYSVGESYRVTALEEEAQFLVAQGPGIEMLHTKREGYHAVNSV
jgi:hypothetical protein